MGKRADTGNTELDLVPIMNMVTILIPFLLLSVQFVTLAVIDTTLPAIGAPSSEPVEEDKEKLSLSIAITDSGYTIMGANAVLGGDDQGAGIPCNKSGCPTPDSYDTAELTAQLAKVKDQFESEENVILVPEGDVQYEVLIRTMDASREDRNNKVDGKSRLLFPYVVIAGGAK